jgi:LPS-assembly protein
LYKGWKNYTLAARVSYTDNFATLDNSGTLQQYPEIIFTSIKRQFFSTPLYHEFTGTYDYFYRGEGQKGHYVNLAPAISLPFNLYNYAKITPQVTLHETYWNREDQQTTSENRSGTRTIYNAGLAMSSQISRVFSVNIQNWEKIRHEIKPEILYSYIPNIRQDNFPNYFPVISSFMDVFAAQGLGLVEQNAVAWSLTNTVTARVKDKTGAKSYLELFRLKLLQVYDINEAKKNTDGSTPERRPFSDIGMELDLRPHPYFSFAARNKYSPYSGWKETNYDLSIRDWRGDTLTLGYRYTQNSIKEINLDLKAVITEHLSGKFVARLDGFNNQAVTDATGRSTTEFNKMFDKKIVENTVGLIYQEQCWGVGVDYTRTYNDKVIMVKISLAGLGMFGF